MKWVLLILITSYGGSAGRIEFPTKEGCLEAREVLIKKIPWGAQAFTCLEIK